MKKMYSHWSLFVLVIFCIFVTLLVYDQLPNQIPIHFNFAGEVDSYGSKPLIFLMPLVALIFLISGEIMPYMDPLKHNYSRFKTSYRSVFILVTICFCVFHFYILAISLEYKIINIAKLLPSIIGVIFLILGNIIPRFRHNYFIGFRTVWAYNDVDNWNKTQRFGGKIMVVVGFLILLMNFMDRSWYGFVFIPLCFMTAIAPLFYSYYLFTKTERGR